MRARDELRLRVGEVELRGLVLRRGDDAGLEQLVGALLLRRGHLVACDRAAASAAAAWSYWFCTSRVSICTSRSPGFTCVPVSTGIFVICPDAFDLTSTTLIGSTTPVACASMTMSRRWTACVEIVGALSFLLAQAVATQQRDESGKLAHGRRES